MGLSGESPGRSAAKRANLMWSLGLCESPRLQKLDGYIWSDMMVRQRRRMGRWNVLKMFPIQQRRRDPVGNKVVAGPSRRVLEQAEITTSGCDRIGQAILIFFVLAIVLQENNHMHGVHHTRILSLCELCCDLSPASWITYVFKTRKREMLTCSD